MIKFVGSYYFQVCVFRGVYGLFFVVVEVCVVRYSGGIWEKGVCESFICRCKEQIYFYFCVF